MSYLRKEMKLQMFFLIKDSPSGRDGDWVDPWIQDGILMLLGS